jgi:peptide deformylase
MTLMKIVQYPHPALRRPARPLTAIDKQVRMDAAEMLELMYAHKGLGLAANQVALPYQLLVLNFTGDPEQRDNEGVFINPVILERKGTIEDDEGCLSFPGLFAKVRRAKTVKVQAYNLNGEALEITATDLASRAWQHEIDHLHGILFIDKLGPIGKLAVRNPLKEFERDYARAQERGEIPPNVEIEKTLAAQEAAVGSPSRLSRPCSPARIPSSA